MSDNPYQSPVAECGRSMSLGKLAFTMLALVSLLSGVVLAPVAMAAHIAAQILEIKQIEELSASIGPVASFVGFVGYTLSMLISTFFEGKPE